MTKQIDVIGQPTSEEEVAKDLGFASVIEYRAWHAAGSPTGRCSNPDCMRTALWPGMTRCKYCGSTVVVNLKIRFECTKCGNCCWFSPGSIVWVTEQELQAIAAKLGWRPATISTGDGRMSLVPVRDINDFEGGGWCEIFDPVTRLCRAHEVKPAQCQSFPFWPSHLANRETWKEVTARCEGIGQGEFITEDQLLEKLRQSPRGL